MIKVKAYAKINVALEVMDTENGYHKVNNLMLPIDIYDELSLEKADRIEIKDDPFPGQNIIEKAARLFFEYTKISSGVYIELKKNIPHAAGLAGGSTDAAATLKGLNELYQTNLSVEELVSLSAKLGSDVGFFIEGVPALCTGRGEIVNPLGFSAPRIRIFLIKPNTGLSTALVYKNYVYEGISHKEDIETIIDALKNKNIESLRNTIFNDLAKPALSLNTEMKAIYEAVKSMQISIYVSGSGPTMFLVDPTDAEIEKVKNILDSTVFTADLYTK